MQSVLLPRDAEPAEGSDHFVRFYDRDVQLMDEVAEFLDDALRAGGMAVVIATAPHRADLSRRLGGFGGPAERGSNWFTGNLVLLDADETLAQFMMDGVPDAQRFDAVIGPVLARSPAPKPLHAFGEMVAVLCERGEYEAAVALEAIWNDAAARYRFSLFCAYPKRLFASGDRALAFQHVCNAHRRVMGSLEDLEAPLDAGALARMEQLALQAEVQRRKQAEQTLRQRERELAEFLDNANEGIHKVAGDGTILYANRAELEMLGYAWDEYVGHNIAEFYVDQALICDILERLQGGEVLRDQPAVLLCRDGTRKPVVIYSNACFEDGKLAYTRCFTRDASEQVRAREALERASAERERLLESLREASRAKDEFLAMLGHELRNPLSPIVTALQLMRMRGETSTAREQAIIQRQVDHMVRLVDDLLDISRITRGKIELKRERVHVAAVLAKAVEQASVLLEQRSHRLRIDTDPSLESDGDPVRLSQVVANLLTNAARYTPPGGDIHLRAWRQEPTRLAISVRDNGNGIAPEVLARIFELFYQGGERGVDRADGGLGIGLALVRSIVELHGGTVQAHSEGPGHGSEFIVTLPCVDGACEVASGSGAAGAQVSPAGDAARVLVVDDNRDAGETMAQLLRLHGYDVHLFTDPASALSHLQQVQPEAALLDIGLPVMDGYELGTRIREACGASCALLALTGYGLDADRARSEAAGFDHHLVKPVAPEALLAALEAALRGRQRAT